ncbi:MAG: TIGR01459 family HAD-type hydrolase [Rickettsiaceae bacterium]|nr:TIGR01459 family HAD-type hydrolase [Rickettsiaceae bacterium]
MNQLTFRKLDESLTDYDLVLFDLWGVIIEGETTYPGVVDAINKIITKTNVIFLTNAPRPAFRSAQILRDFGIHDATEDMLMTSGDVARKMILDHRASLDDKVPQIYHLGQDRNKDILLQLEHQLTQDITKADILLLSLYRDDHEDIHEFNALLEQAAKLPNLLILCSNPDTTIPKNGNTRYCSGYFAEIIENFGGEVIYTGKPKSLIYERALQKHKNIQKDRVLMVGDTFETDILGANKAGIHSALVLTGNAAPFHNMHDSIDNKLEALEQHAKEMGVMPSFVTSIL